MTRTELNDLLNVEAKPEVGVKPTDESYAPMAVIETAPDGYKTLKMIRGNQAKLEYDWANRCDGGDELFERVNKRKPNFSIVPISEVTDEMYGHYRDMIAVAEAQFDL